MIVRRTACVLAMLPALAACGSATPASSQAPLAGLRNGAPPGPMRDFNVGYDPVSRRLILHGGASTDDNASSLLSQTWAWDGTRWTRLAPHTELPPQSDGAMAVDPVSGRLMFTGGDAMSTATQPDGSFVPRWSPNLGTWLWDGATWTRVADNPRQGGGPALAVDEADHRLYVNSPDFRGMLPAGMAGPASPAWYGTGFYRWTGTGWTEVPAPSDQPWVRAAIAYDPISRRLIQSGGEAQNPVQATEAWDGTRWTKLSPRTPAAFGYATAATDWSTRQIVLLGWSEDDHARCVTWTWDGGNWVHQNVDEPPQSIVNGGTAQMVWDPALSRIILAGWAYGSSTKVQMWAWEGVHKGWEKLPA